MKSLALAVAAFFLGACNFTTVIAAEYRFLSSWDKRHPTAYVLVEPFVKGVEKSSAGKMKLTVSGPETVPSFEQLQPAGAGVFQFLLTHGAYHFGTTPYLAAIEAVGGDRTSRKAAGLHDMVDRHYQKYGLKLVALAMSPEGGYQILSRAPIGPSGDLQGKKIRGNPTYQPVLTMLGASMVTLPPTEIYTSLEKGVVDGAAWPVPGILDYRLNEVVKYIVRPAFGFTAYPLFMNLSAWNRLTAGERQILLEEGRKLEDYAYREFRRLAEEEEKAATTKGMVITQMGPAQKAKLAKTWSEGLWDLTSQKSKKDIEDLRAFAKSKGLTH